MSEFLDKATEYRVYTTESIEELDKIVADCNDKDLLRIMGTHSGAFHTDEVTACAILSLLPEFSNSIIVRSRSPAVWKETYILCDVGGEYNEENRRFDHHMKEFTYTFNSELNIKMSSAGLVYKHYGRQIIAEVLKRWKLFEKYEEYMDLIYKRIYENLIAYIDGMDNGVSRYPKDVEAKYKNNTSLNNRITRVNPLWDDESGNKGQSECFTKALKIAEDEFLWQLYGIVRAFLPGYDIVKQSVLNRFNIHESGRIVYLVKSCAWKEHLHDLEKELGLTSENNILFVIYKADYDHRVQTVALTPGSFDFRKGLLKEWRGIEKEELKTLSGLEDIVFVHSAGFIGGAISFENSLKMAERSIIEDK